MDQVGKYQLLGIVADRGHGRVWKGRDPDLDRPVAVKQVGESDPVALARLRTEAQVLAALDDPHIVTVYDVLTSERSWWLVVEWVEGASLAAVSQHARRLTGPQAVGIVTGALSGLAGAHRHDIVHGDVSPGNILVDQAGTSKLIDFGLAGPAGALGTGGTPGYLSPEAVRGAELSTRSDVYSAAAVLGTLLLGHPLFATTTAGETIARQLAPEPPDLGGVSQHLREVLGRALQAEPAARHSDATELLADLEQAAERDLGAGWLAQAGVAALVTAAMTAAAVRGEHDSSREVAPAAAVIEAPPQPRDGHRLGGRKFALAGATAGVVIVAAVVAAVASSSGGKSKALPAGSSAVTTSATTATAAAPSPSTPPTSAATSAPASATPSATPSATASSPAATTSPAPKILTPAQSFSGRYRIVTRIDSVTGGLTRPRVGDSDTVTWTVKASCRPTCTATVASSSGAAWHLTYKAGEWTGKGGFTDCLSSAGTPIPGTRRANTAVLHLKAPAPTARPATKLAGTETFAIAPGIPGCGTTHGGWVESVTVSRL